MKPSTDKNCQRYLNDPSYVWCGGVWRKLEAVRRYSTPEYREWNRDRMRRRRNDPALLRAEKDQRNISEKTSERRAKKTAYMRAWRKRTGGSKPRSAMSEEQRQKARERDARYHERRKADTARWRRKLDATSIRRADQTIAKYEARLKPPHQEAA